MKDYNELADAYHAAAQALRDGATPIEDGTTTSIQIHGGSGFMEDYACEQRYYRDARTTNIYEGTSQLCRSWRPSTT